MWQDVAVNCAVHPGTNHPDWDRDCDCQTKPENYCIHKHMDGKASACSFKEICSFMSKRPGWESLHLTVQTVTGETLLNVPQSQRELLNAFLSALLEENARVISVAQTTTRL